MIFVYKSVFCEKVVNGEKVTLLTCFCEHAQATYVQHVNEHHIHKIEQINRIRVFIYRLGFRIIQLK